mgnify:CR=1 FL=1
MPAALFIACLADAGYVVRSHQGCVAVNIPRHTSVWSMAIAVYEVAARTSAAACDAVYETESPVVDEDKDETCIAYWPAIAWPEED